MRIFQEIFFQKNVRRLVDKYLRNPAVEGIGLGVHWEYISIVREERGPNRPNLTVNEIVAHEREYRPKKWVELCVQAELPRDLSPVYLNVYVNIPTERFQRRYRIGRTVVPPGYLVVLEQIERFVGLADRSSHRPVFGGISVGNVGSKGTGTLGGFLSEAGNANALLTSCNHVLYSATSKEICQQGPADGGDRAKTVGTLKYVVPLKDPAGFGIQSPYNSVDVALAEVDGSVSVDRIIRKLGHPTSVAQESTLNLGDKVVFVGKESDKQDGEINNVIGRMKVELNGKTYLFGDVLQIRPLKPMYVGNIAKGGDSGSWVLKDLGRRNYEFCAVIFAAEAKYALAFTAEKLFQGLFGASGKQFSLY